MRQQTTLSRLEAEVRDYQVTGRIPADLCGAFYRVGPDPLCECCFVPRAANAPEGSGYLMGIESRNNEGGRADLVILDAEHPADGPVAVVHLAMRIPIQIHGWWVPDAQLPQRV